ncbi:MAG: replicative DNA helicase, partial [Clostridia bacterium]|nr:replicative DNA helicase [Clostridia bacterium]
QAILGSVLLEPNSLNEVDALREDHFYLPEHRAIYRVMCDKMMASETIDFVTVLEAVKSEGFFSGEEGKAYLLKLAQMVPSISNISRYATIVREKAQVRALIRACREILDDSMEAGAEVQELFDTAEQKIYDIRQERNTKGLVSIKDVIVSTYDTFAKLNSGEAGDMVGIPSGISALDNITTGLNRSDMIIVGARPGMGKTSFALNLARNVAGQGKTVAVFSLEMSREQLVNRLLSSEAKVSVKKLRTGNLTTDEWTRLGAGAATLYNLPMFLDDTSNITVQEMKARLRRLEKLDFVVVDYLQLMQSAKPTDNRVQEVSQITRSLKIMAKELNIPLMICAQLSRSTEKMKSNHRPALADLRESGSIEQDADQVLFLYRDEYYINEKDDPSTAEVGTSEVIVAKNRHGELGTVKLAFQGEFTQFTALELHQDG